MSDQPETIAAIVRELREDARHVEDEIHDDDFWSNDEAAVIYRDLASRIEAAAERERNAHTNDIHDALYKATGIPGNAAALREALERIVEWADRYVGRLCFYGPSPERDGWRTASHAANDALAQARVALAAPARNCDRFATELDARLAWKRETHCKGDYRYWLFDPAEGGAE